MLFLAFITFPTILVTCIDGEAEIAMVFVLAEEETKEKDPKHADESYNKPDYPFFHRDLVEIDTPDTFYNEILTDLFSPGDIAPPPEFSWFFFWT